jgi:hypothetical protein
VQAFDELAYSVSATRIVAASAANVALAIMNVKTG